MGDKKNTKRYWAGTLLLTTLFSLGCTPSNYPTNPSGAKNTNSNQAIIYNTNIGTINLNTATTDDNQPGSTTNANYSPNGTYENVYGNTVPSPYYSNSVPAGASAVCGDGTYSFSQSRSGTCSHHNGVSEWL